MTELSFTFCKEEDHLLCSLFCTEVLCHVCNSCSKHSQHGLQCNGCVSLLNTIYSKRKEWGKLIAERCKPSPWRAPELNKQYAVNFVLGKKMADSKHVTMNDLIIVFKEKIVLQYSTTDLLYNVCTSFQSRRL